MFEGFKAVCGVGVACKDNDKVVECSIVVGQVGYDDDRLGFGLWLDRWELGIERTPTHALPQTKPLTL